MFFWCKVSIHITLFPHPLRYFMYTLMVCHSVCLRQILTARFTDMDFKIFLTTRFSGTPLPDKTFGLKYFFNKCFFTHHWSSLYQVRDSYSIWEIDSIYLWYVFWIQPFFFEVLFTRSYLPVFFLRLIFLQVIYPLNDASQIDILRMYLFRIFLSDCSPLQYFLIFFIFHWLFRFSLL